MRDAAQPSNELSGTLTYGVSTSHLVQRPGSGGYGRRFDLAPMLATVVIGSIPPILILPRVDGTGRPADPADWYAGLTGLRNPELIDPR